MWKQLQSGEVSAMAMGGLSKLANLSITLQRRWSNVLSDQQRQHIVEMFLGLRPEAYFPSARLLYSPDLPLEVRTQLIAHFLLLASNLSAIRSRFCQLTSHGNPESRHTTSVLFWLAAHVDSRSPCAAITPLLPYADL